MVDATRGAIDKRYDQSEKGKARRKRYYHSARYAAKAKRLRGTAKYKATNRRYRHTAKGKAMMRRVNKRRIKISDRTFYMPSIAVTVEARSLVQRRRYELEQRQSAGAETESDPPRPVSPQTEL
jgi:hypothetical protein